MQIFFYFIHKVIKWHFDIHFREIRGKVRPRCYPSTPTFRLVLLLFQTTRGQEKSRLAVVRSTARSQSGFQSISGPKAVQSGGGWRVLSWAQSLALSKWTAGATPFWENSWNYSAFLHTCQIPGEVNLHLVKVRSKLSGPQYLTYFPDPGSIRVKEKCKMYNEYSNCTVCTICCLWYRKVIFFSRIFAIFT